MQPIRFTFRPLEILRAILIALSLLRPPDQGDHFLGKWSNEEGTTLVIHRYQREFKLHLKTADRYRSSTARFKKKELRGEEIGRISYLHDKDHLLIRGKEWVRLEPEAVYPF